MEAELDLTKIIKVPIDEVRPNSWNPKAKNTPEYFKVKESIKVNGLRGFIPVRDNDGYEIIDGQQRWTSAKELGFTHIYIYDHEKVSDQRAKELTIWYQQQVPFVEMDLSHMVRDMQEQYGKLELPFSEQETYDLLKLTAVDVSPFQTEGDQYDSSEMRTLTVLMGKEKYDFIMGVLQGFCRENELQNDIGRALELIIADWSAGN